MYYPSWEDIKTLVSKGDIGSKLGNLIPIYREINADLETPVSAYLKIARSPYSFLLESVEGGERLARLFAANFFNPDIKLCLSAVVSTAH